MKRDISNILYGLLCLLAVGLGGCKDELLDAGGEIGEGESRVNATVEFKPFGEALNGKTRAAGNAIKDIEDLCVLLYDMEGELVKKYSSDGSPGNFTFKITNEDRTDSNTEKKTPRATFSLAVPYGRYHIYAVANMGDLAGYDKDIKTVDGLKSIPLTWDATNVSANNQMFGYFTTDESKKPSGFDAEEVVIDKATAKLHAWIRRAASKVTVAFDGSGLKEGVFVYLQSVQIKDIPYQCYLGKANEVGADGYDLEVTPDGKTFEQTGSGTTMLDGESISYHPGDRPDDFEYGEDCADHRIAKGTPLYGSHEENAHALYFYENMQGAGEDMPDKRQDANDDGKLDNPGLPGDSDYKPKDNVSHGTYIEVKAHYVSNNSERIGNGPITYRFMLGKDVTTDYNAERNHHYKLTLKFKNFANEADWHIEYKESEVMVPEPYYISYLYNRSMELPIKVNTGGSKIKSMKAEIIDNRWAPDNASDVGYLESMDIAYQNQWNGFLSLHKTTETVINPDKITPGQVDLTSNQEYYEKDPKRGVREYKKFESGEHTTDNSLNDDTYRVEKHRTEENTYNVFIPMYTRAKQLTPATGYTGNNPYVAYRRKAEVKITIRLENGREFVDTVPIFQVRRVVNPKGIYRSAGCTKPFRVVLKTLPRESATQFEPLLSEGPWKAYVVVKENSDGIELTATPGKSEIRNDTVYGYTGGTVDFNVKFGTVAENANRYAIIRVEYNNYTCQHLIFVRQGNAPDDLITGGVKWYAENMTTKNDLADSPLEEGSLFKFGNWKDPIDALSNRYKEKTPWVNVEPKDFKEWTADTQLKIAGTNGTKIWTEITPQNPANESFESPGNNMRLPTVKDYMDLKNSKDIEQGYGILYGDDAESTADGIEEAYGYDYQNTNKGRGMRGCFVYNKITGKSLFFPIGASGYGHRKNDDTGNSTNNSACESGVLRYSAARSSYLKENKRPLFYDIFMRPGAIYWCKEVQKRMEWQNKPFCGLDINYFTFEFGGIEDSSVGEGADACFVRCVVDESKS